MNVQRVFRNMYRDGIRVLESTKEEDKTLTMIFLYGDYLKKKSHIKERTIDQRIKALFEFDVIRLLIMVEWNEVNQSDLNIYMLILTRLNYSQKEITKRMSYVIDFVAFYTTNVEKYTNLQNEIQKM